MMLAETEYRYQIESVIRPFRDILLGLFFISVGMLLDLKLLAEEFAQVMALLAGVLLIKAVVAALATRLFEPSTFKAVHTGIVMSIGGEFGIALFTLVLRSGAVPARIAQPVLVAVVLSMVAQSVHPDQQRAPRAPGAARAGPPARPPAPLGSNPPAASPSATTSSSAAMAVSARARPGCWNRRASNTSRSTWIRRASAPPARPASRCCTGIGR